jgi:DNA sulfur modification protein DndD
LFFFDGEKIEAMAQSGKAREILQTGIESLLGLDIVDQLRSSLIYRNKLRKKSIGSKVQSTVISDIEHEIKEAEEELGDKKQTLAQFRSRLDSLLNKKEELDNIYRSKGGELADQRDELENNKKLLASEIIAIQKQLTKLASGSAPLALVSDLLKSCHSQAIIESESKHAESILKILETRDEHLLEIINSSTGINDSVSNDITKFLRNDRLEKASKASEPKYILVEPEVFRLVLSEGNAHTIQEQRYCCEQLENRQRLLSDLERKLSLIPDNIEVEDLLTRRQQVSDDILKTHGSIDLIQSEIDTKTTNLERLQQRYNNKLSEQAEQNFLQSKGLKVVAKVEEIMPILSTFKKQITEKNAARLEEVILDSFVELSRKERLISKIEINHEDFTLSLLDKNGVLFGTERLSAGERQLLAVSILWGLAKASRLPLPNIIDTPLGRLDSEHRRHLINNYYPNASHQVLILSTDEEIVGSYYRELEPFIARQYLVSYDELSESSVISEGYFH